MSRTSAKGPIFDRLFLLPEEARDPDRRFAKSLFLLVLVASAFIEAFLALAALVSGHGWLGSAHVVLFAAPVMALVLFRNRFTPWAFALGFALVAWASAATSLVAGLGLGALMWHFILPTGILILMGERWGLVALGLDLGLGVVEAVLWMPRFGLLESATLPPAYLLTCWELGSVLLFLMVFLFLRMVRETLASYQLERGQALDQLSQTKHSEARWADQARFMETLMDVIPFPLFHKGNDGRYLSANASFRVVFDVEKEDRRWGER